MKQPRGALCGALTRAAAACRDPATGVSMARWKSSSAYCEPAASGCVPPLEADI
jgi:hypothetical protein